MSGYTGWTWADTVWWLTITALASASLASIAVGTWTWRTGYRRGRADAFRQAIDRNIRQPGRRALEPDGSDPGAWPTGDGTGWGSIDDIPRGER